MKENLPSQVVRKIRTEGFVLYYLPLRNYVVVKELC